ncbi:uncharacterized protein K441DRAFT_14307 [Cenococcum geophilum 1.58]|uniref:uncharacterized protein n=1 Tax=Cenococcum geophilum 1.58 TaxID=794803 RepID=UPI00358EF5BF|nr:hypothetical protein K441DRAFT_14307 [Cenococcum geophilum 1.58]
MHLYLATPLQWAAIFYKEDINFSCGHHDLEWYDPPEKSIEHKLPCNVRCSYCHSPIMDEGRNMILLFLSLIHLKTGEDKAFFKPRSVSLLSRDGNDNIVRLTNT